jgi:hypothetical protein
MSWGARYIVSLLPLVLIGGFTLIAEWAFDAFGCEIRGKELPPCFVHGNNIAPLLGIGLFWCKLLLPVAWFISVPSLIYIAISHLQILRKRADAND